MSRFQDAVRRGTLAARPAANTVLIGTLYAVTDSGSETIYQSDGTNWNVYLAPGSGGGGATDHGGLSGLGDDDHPQYLTHTEGNSAYAPVVHTHDEDDLSLTDITTNNASTTKHGLLPKLSNVATEYLDGTGAFSVPAGGGGGMSNPMTTANDIIIGGASGAPARLAKGSNGTYLGVNGSGNLAYSTPAGGGGGSGYGTFASMPAAGNVGNLYTPSDGHTQWVDDGTEWRPLCAPGGVVGKRPLTLSNWTWVNQGTAVATDSAGAIELTGPVGTASDHRQLVRALPATPWSVTMHFQALLRNTNYNAAYMMLKNSGGTAFVLFGWQYDATSGLGLLRVAHWNSPTSWSAYAFGVVPEGVPQWLRITSDGTTRRFLASVDGRTFYELFNQGHTTFITPNQAGFGLNPGGGTDKSGMTVLSWEGA